MLFVDSLYDPRNFCSRLIIKRCFVFVSGTATPVVQINHLILYFRFNLIFLTHESWLHVVFFYRLASIDYVIKRPNVKKFFVLKIYQYFARYRQTQRLGLEIEIKCIEKGSKLICLIFSTKWTTCTYSIVIALFSAVRVKKIGEAYFMRVFSQNCVNYILVKLY